MEPVDSVERIPTRCTNHAKAFKPLVTYSTSVALNKEWPDHACYDLIRPEN